MRKQRTLLVAVLAIATVVLGLVAPAGASTRATARIAVRGETTSLTTAPGLVTKLLGAKLAAFVTAPGNASLFPTANPFLVARYPVTTGQVFLNPLRGRVNHRGGLFVVNLANGKKVAVDNFIVDLTRKRLNVHLTGFAPSARADVFALNLSRAVKVVRPGFISITRIGVSLLASAVPLLNGALSTTVFKPGMAFGTAAMRLDR